MLSFYLDIIQYNNNKKTFWSKILYFRMEKIKELEIPLKIPNQKQMN